MNALPLRSPARAPLRAQAGFTIVEMMVAMSISLIVVLGFAATFVSMKQTFNAQNGLSQLQDNERLASVILTNSLTEAGYFPTGADPTASPRVPPKVVDRSAIAASSDTYGGALAAGTYLFGVTSDGTPAHPESISTAYVSAPGDGLINCQGGTNTGTTNVTFRNVFYVDAATKTLGCRVYNGATMSAGYAPLITDVESMTILYAVDTDGDTVVDSYLLAKDMSASNWSAVKSVRITLQFTNPNARFDTSNSTIPVLQVVDLMNNKQ